MPLATHILKTEIGFWDDINEGRKTFEIRRDDREPKFTVGDTLILLRGSCMSFEQDSTFLIATVSYCMRGIQASKYGVMDDYCVLGLTDVWEYDFLDLVTKSEKQPDD